MNHIPQIAALLSRYQLDAMLVTGSIGRQYAVGSVVFAGSVLVTAERGWYVTDGSPLPSQSPDYETISVPASTVDETVAKLIRDHRLTAVGYEEETLSQRGYAALSGLLSCELVPAQKLLWDARRKKTSEEIRRIRAVQAITDRAFLDVLPRIRAGLTEHEIAGMLAERMLANGGFQLAFPPIVASGINGSNPHGFATDRIVRNGDFVTMDFGVIMDNYGSDMTRTVAIGSCTDEMRHVYETVLAAQQAGIRAAHGGVRGQEIDAAGRSVIEAAGYGACFTHSFGHGLGLEGHESPGAGPNDTTELPAGAVVSAEPGIYLPGRFGVRIEDLIVLTEDGCENLNRSTKELLVL